MPLDFSKQLKIACHIKSAQVEPFYHYLIIGTRTLHEPNVLDIQEPGIRYTAFTLLRLVYNIRVVLSSAN